MSNTTSYPRRPQITISRETTFLEEPVGVDGGVDYPAAIHQSFRNRVTPENNAAIVLLKALGPSEIGTTV